LRTFPEHGEETGISGPRLGAVPGTGKAPHEYAIPFDIVI
jgi:hypothetical protein